MVVGGKGSSTKATAKDGTAGAGGGGTFIFKQIGSITDSRYQFTKSSQNYETLLVAAGGGGSNDCAYQSKQTNGLNGIGSSYKSPDNFTEYSTTSTTSSTSNCMGITQFINNNAQGAYYSRASGTATGGYGGGGASDDAPNAGGGWCGSGTSYQSTSWSIVSTAEGTDGANSGDGYAIIRYVSGNGGSSSSSSSSVTGGVYDFDYTGEVQTQTLSAGTYKLEVWGAQGGDADTYLGGRGGYSVGTISLNSQTTVYIYCGEQGGANIVSSTATGSTFGGGGGVFGATTTRKGTGGGASDIRIGQDSLYARVIVAGRRRWWI